MSDAVSDVVETRSLPALPLESGVVLPQMVITLAVESPEAKAAADAAAAGDGTLLLVPKFPDGRYARVGTIATIEDRGALPDGAPALVVRALGRAHVGVGVVGTTAALFLSVDPVPDEPPTPKAIEVGHELRAALRALLERSGGRRLAGVLGGVDDPGALADLAGWWPELSFDRKVELLETIDVEERVAKVLGWTRDALAEAELTDQIRKGVTDGLEKQQRDFLLRQQMDAIRKELGESDDEDLPAQFRTKLGELADAGAVTDGTRDAIAHEIDRLERTPAQNMEHGWIRAWLDTVFELPWGQVSDDHLDVTAAAAILDADHAGLEDVKERIVEFLAVRKLRQERGIDDDGAGGRKKGAIIALVGPPGVGKTSLGESIARALGRKFVRVALGGVSDESEIRGHRRTYVGAQSGRIVKALQEAGTMNPVFLLDEVDKLGQGWRGDPSSALLEVLDPAQNHRFRDHYLEIDLDLSDVLFIATANQLETIPGPLLDRMEIVNLDGYTTAEKVEIARDHLMNRQLTANGLHDGEVTVTDDAIEGMVSGYTREAGVRSLERTLGRALRKAATRIAAGETDHITIDAENLSDFLGRRKVHDQVKARTSVPGVATGLAVTGAGGDVLFVEVTVMEGKPDLTVTGQLGDVMKESARIALSHVRSRATAFGIDPKIFDHSHFHVHFPAGAVPKDGPSAGVTMTTALVSALTGRPVRNDVGMTGEVTLQGRVLPIGGLKQKVLAAHRAGLTTVIFPADNEGDLDDVPDTVRSELTFYPASDVDFVVNTALAA